MAESFESWAILELMGHRRLAGRVSETTLAGGTFLRIDVPTINGAPAVTQFYSPSAVYAISPCTEELARAVAERERPMPVHPFELPTRATRPPDDEDPADEDPDEEVPY